MAVVPMEAIKRYDRELRRLQAEAGEYVSASLRREASRRGRTVESLRDLAISAMTDALNVYGEGAAAASIDLFNDIMSLEGLSASARVPSGLIAAEEVSRIARYQAGKLISGNVEGFVGQMSSSTSFLTRQCANGAMMSQSGIARYLGGWTYSNARGRAIWSYAANATASGYQIRYARVPQGMETCDFCLMLASRGFVYLTPESAEGWNHTHRGCVVAGTKVSGRGIRAGFAREYKGDLVKLATAEGHELTVTPNHPILTVMGWVRADELKKGDQLVCAAPFDGSLGGVPNENDVPPNVEDVVEACRLADSARLDGMPRTAVNLDGSSVDGEVHVVSSYGYLASGGDPALFEEGRELGFTGSQGDLAASSLLLDGDGVLDPFSIGLRPSGRGGVRRSCLSSPFVWRHAGSPDDPSLGVPALGDSVLPKPTINDVPRDAEAPGDGVDALAVLESFYRSLGHGDSVLSSLDHLRALVPWDAVQAKDPVDVGLGGSEPLADFCRSDTGLVKLDELVGIDVIKDVSTHVYNLHTQDNLYAANGIITHNCDCLVIGGVVHKDANTGELVQDTVLEGYGTDDMLALRSEWSGIDRNDVGARLAAMEAIFGRSEW